MSTESLAFAVIAVEPGLMLKQLEEAQANEMYALVDQNRDYLSAWLPWANKTHSPDDSLKFIKEMIEKRKSGTEYGYGIMLNNRFVGHISLMHLNDDKPPEIGYWIAQEASGKGVMTKLVVALTQFALNELKMDRVTLRARPENIASNRVAEKSGYKFTSRIEDEDGEHNLWEIRS